jgi:hypothetical protein
MSVLVGRFEDQDEAEAVIVAVPPGFCFASLQTERFDLLNRKSNSDLPRWG